LRLETIEGGSGLRGQIASSKGIASSLKHAEKVAAQHLPKEFSLKLR
jgi:hypothetical protein